MTLVATLFLEDIPFIIGDLLLTHEAYPGDLPMPLPTRADDFSGQKRTIAGLSRKLVLISPRCVLGWSCRDIETAEEVFREIRQLESNGNLTVQSITDAIENHPKSDEDGLKVVGWLVHINENGECFAELIDNGGMYAQSEIYSHVCVIGSGAQSFKTIIKDVDRWQVASKIPDDEQKPFLRLLRVFKLVGVMFAEEHRQGERAQSLQRSFGGGYEIVLWNKDRFEFIGGYTLSVWNALVTTEDARIYVPPTLFSSIYYQEEHLVVESERIIQDEDNTVHGDKINFIVAPFGEELIEFEPIRPSRFEYHMYALEVYEPDGKYLSSGAMVEFSGPIAEPRAGFMDSSGRRMFYIHPDLQQELLESAIRMTKPTDGIP